MHKRIVFVLMCVIGFQGCSSMKSQLLTRDESNMNWEVRHLKGVPITLQVPTHVRLSVIETRYLTSGPVCDDPVGRHVDHELIKTSKIFTVDPKRPAAGPFKFSATFNQDQYFKEMGTELTDQTIRDISLALQRIIPLFRPTGAGPAFSQANENRSTTPLVVKSVVAVTILEIDDPLFEENVRNFLDTHVNSAHCTVSSCPPVVQPAQKAVPPVDLLGELDLQSAPSFGNSNL